MEPDSTSGSRQRHLDIARIEAGRLDLRDEWFDLSSAVRLAIKVIEKREGRRYHLKRTSWTRCPGHSDQLRLKKILINLLSNSSKFTLPGGRVKVTVRADPEGNLVLAVSDTGIGIAPENIWRALTPFLRVDSDLSRKFDGTGLGCR
jgi:signal transduction histidine kinase